MEHSTKLYLENPAIRRSLRNLGLSITFAVSCMVYVHWDTERERSRMQRGPINDMVREYEKRKILGLDIPQDLEEAHKKYSKK